MSKKLSLVRSLLKEEDEYYSKNTKKKNKAGVHDLSPAGLAAKMTGNAQAGNPKFKRGKIKKEAPAAGSRPGYATGMNTAQMQQQGQARFTPRYDDGMKGDRIGQGAFKKQLRTTNPQIGQLEGQVSGKVNGLKDATDNIFSAVQQQNYQGATQALGQIQSVSAEISQLINSLSQIQMQAQQARQAQANPAVQQQGMVAAESFIREDHAMLSPESPEGQAEMKILRSLKLVQKHAMEAEHLINKGDYSNAFGYLSELINHSRSAALGLKKYLSSQA